MRFKRYPIRREDRRGVTPRRIAAARRSLDRQAEKLPLFADMIREAQPTPDERIKSMDDGFQWIAGEWPDLRAVHWRKGRKMFMSLPDPMRTDLREKWSRCQWPGDGTYFCEFVRCYLRHGFVYLDKPPAAIEFDRQHLNMTIAGLLERGKSKRTGAVAAGVGTKAGVIAGSGYLMKTQE